MRREFVVLEAAVDVIAAQVADKQVADGRTPVATDRLVIIYGEVRHGERAAAAGASAGAQSLGDNRAHFGERESERTASSFGLVTVDVAGSAGERTATPPPGSSGSSRWGEPTNRRSTGANRASPVEAGRRVRANIEEERGRNAKPNLVRSHCCAWQTSFS
jgi:hypothetical protein